jgi:DNA invertase Pin-like site-specific DNA recombinase
MTIRAAIYARTSPDCPLITDEQIERLKAVAADHDWTVTQVFTDRPTTVRTGVDKRPGEVALVNAIRSGNVQKVLIWSVDRIGRSLVELVAFMEVCRVAGVSLWLDQENLDTGTGNGMSLFDLGSMMAFHLRQSRRDRILRGQAASRALSIRAGRPPIATAKVQKAKQFLISGKGVRQAARLTGISPASVSRIKSSIALRPVTN